MAPSNYPNLGFNPARGNVDTIGHMVDVLTKAQKALEDAGTTVRGVAAADSQMWQGDAATKFRGQLSDKLPGKLDKARESIGQAITALSGWKGDLTGFQSDATKLDGEAKTAKDKLDKAGHASADARGNPDLALAGTKANTDAELSNLQTRYNNAQAAVAQADQDVKAAKDEYDSVVRRAHELETRHEDDAKSVSAKLDTADNIAPSKPHKSFWSKVGDALGSAVHWMADWKHIGDVLAWAAAGVALVALTVSTAGVGTVLLAGALSAGALGAHLMDPATRKAAFSGDPGAIATLAGDAIGMIPMAGPLARAASGAVKAGVHAPAALGALGKAGTAASTFGTNLAKVPTRMTPLLKGTPSVFGKVTGGIGVVSSGHDVLNDLGMPSLIPGDAKAAVDGGTAAAGAGSAYAIIKNVLRVG
ncbi:hypothetical protein [Yinghuangia seranimata]|uniref:hypothetical protein n=1 Tax=Yinghuangia seranimata TaxID=408067 RepID=UPI00248BAD62|nr:hypothetical protein [Yinghuangia seranimata]MDI2130278.1 hypothetical protein [Yinghuangia seranimata]